MPPLHLSIALDDAGWHPAAGLEPAARGHDRLSGAWWARIVAEADRESVAFVTIADRPPPVDGGPGVSPSPARLDALLIAARVAPLTRRVGIVPSVATTVTEPLLVSTQLATLDHVSGGRAGWEVDVSLSDDDGGYVGPRSVPPVAERHAEAVEHIEVVRRLWDSWEDDAEIRDRDGHRFIDRDRVHHIDYGGRYLSVGGPSITPRPPQGQPIVAMRADGGDGDALAAAHADIAFVGARSLAEIPDRLAVIDALATGCGPTAAGPLRFAEVAVFLDDREAAAHRRRERLDGRADGPPAWPGLVYAGTPRALAGWLRELADLGCDGVRLHPATIPHDLSAITGELVAQLPAPAVAGRVPVATLRDRLGLTRPANRYATRS